MNKQRLGAMLVVGVVGLAMLAGVIWLIWRGMLLVPANTARLWALLATALLPTVAWAGWYFGHTEARGRLAGIDQAVDKVMGVATRAAGLQVSAARAMRRSTPDPPVVVLPDLPDLQITARQLESGGDIIEL